MDIRIDCNRQLGPLGRFWCSTGRAPASLLTDEDMRQNMAYVGSIPYGGLSHVCVGALLDMVSLRDRSSYDFTAMHEALDVLVSNGLKPMIELAGNPGGIFSNFCDDGQLKQFKKLVSLMAAHLIKRYGAEEVRTWYFESWAEADAPDRQPQWLSDAESYCNYYDACSEGLAETDGQLKLGGPATYIPLSPMFKAFMAHCDTGRNYFSSANEGVRLDFISVHESGRPSQAAALSRGICEKEIEIFEYVRENHPRFAGAAFMNSRLSPAAGDDEDKDKKDSRGEPRFAALTAKITGQHVRTIIDEHACRYALLSGDNALTGTWGNHTLTAMFTRRDEDEQGEDQKLRHFELIKKPLLNALALMSRLGPTRLEVFGIDDPYADTGAVATRLGDRQIAALLYNSAESPIDFGAVEVTLQLDNLPMSEAMVSHYVIDAEHGNPLGLWRKMGRPAQPSDQQLAQLRSVAEPALLGPLEETQIEDGSLSIKFTLPLGAVIMVLVTAQTDEPPSQVTGLSGVRYRGTSGDGQVMLKWTALNSPAVRTHKILRAKSAEGPYKPICRGELFCSAFLDADAGTEKAYYKVQAVDYWGREGQAADLVVP